MEKSLQISKVIWLAIWPIKSIFWSRKTNAFWEILCWKVVCQNFKVPLFEPKPIIYAETQILGSFTSYYIPWHWFYLVGSPSNECQNRDWFSFSLVILIANHFVAQKKSLCSWTRSKSIHIFHSCDYGSSCRCIGKRKIIIQLMSNYNIKDDWIAVSRLSSYACWITHWHWQWQFLEQQQQQGQQQYIQPFVITFNFPWECIKIKGPRSLNLPTTSFHLTWGRLMTKI